MKLTSATIIAGALAAAWFGFGHVAMAEQYSALAAKLDACKTHERNVTDCHIHDQETFLHLRLSDAKKAGPHADKEHRALRWEARQKLRD